MVPPKEKCPTERITDDARGNDSGGGGGVIGEGRKDNKLGHLWKMNFCVVGIKCEENGHDLPL